MRDLAFYNAGCHESKGVRRALIPFRRALRRMLRPIFLRQVDLFQEICLRLDHLDHTTYVLRHEVNVLSRRQEEMAEQLKTSLAFGWDHVAMVRRLSILEDQLAIITGMATPIGDDAEPHSSIRFPGLACDQDEVRSKVC